MNVCHLVCSACLGTADFNEVAGIKYGGDFFYRSLWLWVCREYQQLLAVLEDNFMRAEPGMSGSVLHIVVCVHARCSACFHVPVKRHPLWVYLDNCTPANIVGGYVCAIVVVVLGDAGPLLLPPCNVHTYICPIRRDASNQSVCPRVVTNAQAAERSSKQGTEHTDASPSSLSPPWKECVGRGACICRPQQVSWGLVKPRRLFLDNGHTQDVRHRACCSVTVPYGVQRPYQPCQHGVCRQVLAHGIRRVPGVAIHSRCTVAPTQAGVEALL